MWAKAFQHENLKEKGAQYYLYLIDVLDWCTWLMQFANVFSFYIFRARLKRMQNDYSAYTPLAENGVNLLSSLLSDMFWY